jgi:hypothetical protein
MSTIAESILDLVRAEPGITTNRLQQRLKIPQGTATGRASELVKKGLLRREKRALFTALGNVQPKTEKVHYELLIDSSGSMDEYLNGERKCISARKLVEAQVVAIGEEPGIQNFYGPRTLQSAKESGFGFGAGGWTPLYEKTAEAIDRAIRQQGPKVVLVFTDGLATDTASQFGNFKAALERAEASGDVTVAFMVPKEGGGREQLIDAGVPEGNIRLWGSIEQASKDAVEAVHKFKREVARGARRSKHYFTADLSRLTAADLQDLTEITAQIRRWQVPKETDIEKLISERTKQPYVPGTGYFEIMKREGRIGGDRTIILLEPKTGRVYANGKRSVKELCGYPKTGDFAVKPGNHAGFVLLCQSKSSAKDTYRARILPRGTNVVLWPGS